MKLLLFAFLVKEKVRTTPALYSFWGTELVQSMFAKQTRASPSNRDVIVYALRVTRQPLITLF